ncbi:MAG: hypothetical protein RLZZ28_2735, partial [Bacteroidota bacterium]
ASMGSGQKQSPFRQFKIEHWDTKKGMPTDLCLNVYQTKDGFIWLAGYNGLIRFDGVNFTAYNQRTVPLIKTDNQEGLLAETEDTTLWIPTTASGLLSYRKGIFTAYLKEANTVRFLGKTKQDELLLSLGRGERSYILFDTHTYKYKELSDSAIFQMFRDDRFVINNSIDLAGNRWVLYKGAPVRINKGKAFLLTAKEGVQKRNFFVDIYVDSRNRVWFTTSNGLLIWNGQSIVPYPGIEKSNFIPANATKALLKEDSKGGIWAATQAGLAYLEPGAEKFSFVPENSPLYGQNINCILEDNEKNIWLASEIGLFKVSRSKFINYSLQDGLSSNRISGVAVIDDQKFVVGTKSNLFLIDKGTVKPYPFINPRNTKLSLEAFHIFYDSQKNIWVCGPANITKLAPSGETVFGVNGQVRFAFEDADKKIWFALPYQGIGFINKQGQFELLNLPKVNFKTLFLSSIRKLINGNWVITSFNKGILLIDKNGNPIDIGNKPGLTGVGVFASYEEKDGTVWFTSQSGIIRYKNGVFAEIGFADGLPENALFAFLPDHKNYIWLPSNKGLIRVLKKELDDYIDKKLTRIHWQLYDDGDGMLNRQCVGARHSGITPDGRLLIATIGGLVVVDPDKLVKNTLAPPVVIHRVLQDDVQADISKTSVFNPGTHRYTFEYSALSLVAPEKVKIKFRLIGYDKDWVNAIGDREAFYTNLPSGEYTFQVIASNNDGIWNEKGAMYQFVVRPFFYETIWFYLLIFLLALTLVWLIVRWRTRASRKQNELLEAQVASRTKELNLANNELSQSNTELAIQHENLSKTIGELKNTQSQLVQSEKMASLGELTAGIAHEIQNPLNFVNNFSEINKELLVEMKGEIDKGNLPEVKSIADDVINNEEKINHHGKRADAIVKGMLQHSRSGTGIKEPTDINALADEYLRLAYHGLRA